MKIVVGLGNPGREYAATRHNLGFMVVDRVASQLDAESSRNRFRAEIAEAFDGPEKLVLVKPQTYMNLSGTAVREVLNWYKVPPDDLLIVVDDIDLPFGAIRMRSGGGSGGHNGLKSIISGIGTEGFPRMRIGIGRGPGQATSQVLSRFNPAEQAALPELIETAAACVLEWERSGIISAMNRCNRRPEPEPATTDQPTDTASSSSPPAPTLRPPSSPASDGPGTHGVDGGLGG